MAVKISELRKMAKKLNVRIEKSDTKTSLIRKIQLAEGNFDCFGRAQGYCDQNACTWREDCLGPKA